MRKIDFLKIAIKDPKVAAITASSKFVAERISKEVKPEHKYIIEYGAGEGVITKKILECLSSDGILIAIELNKNFLPELKQINDQRLRIINRDVANLDSSLIHEYIPQVDVIVSGIPFSLIKPTVRKKIIANTYNLLRSNGIFIVYQFSPLVFPLLKNYFQEVCVRFEPRNFPPYFIMKAVK